jgi:hypothetical protein
VGQFSLSFTSSDLESIYEAFCALSTGEKDDVEIGNLEKDFEIYVEKQKTGSLTIRGRLRPQLARNATLDFEFMSDLATLDRAARSLNALLRKLPKP